MFQLNSIGRVYSAKADNGNIGGGRAQLATTAENSFLEFVNVERKVNSNVDRTVDDYMDRLESCRGRSTDEKKINSEK